MCQTKWYGAMLAFALLTGIETSAPAQETKLKFDDLHVTSGRVKSVDAAKRTFLLEGNKQMFRLGTNAVILRDDRLEQFLKLELRSGDDVSIFDQAAASNLSSYIMVKQGTTKNSTMKLGIIKSTNAKKGTVSINFGKIDIDYPAAEVRVFVNRRNSKADDLRMGEQAIIVISGTKTLTHVIVDRR